MFKTYLSLSDNVNKVFHISNFFNVHFLSKDDSKETPNISVRLPLHLKIRFLRIPIKFRMFKTSFSLSDNVNKVFNISNFLTPIFCQKMIQKKRQTFRSLAFAS